MDILRNIEKKIYMMNYMITKERLIKSVMKIIYWKKKS